MKRNRFVRYAIFLSIMLLGFVLYLIGNGGHYDFLVPGPVIEGHADIDCAECHILAPGSARQQIQHNVKFLLGNKDMFVDYGYSKVTSFQCLSCHENINDRHPVYRFREPRFLEARSVINATSCINCHVEHSGKRVSSELTFCRACHENLDLEEDPLDISHRILIERNDWESCLRCHDFHGNHDYTVSNTVNKWLSIKQIQSYFAQGKDPYSDTKLFTAPDSTAEFAKEEL